VNDWELLFSNSVHGNSLQTMTRLCAGKGATLVAVEDVDGNVFGAHTQARRAQSYLWRNCGPVVLAVCLASRHLMDCFGTLRWLCFHVLEDGSRVRRQLLQVRCAPSLLFSSLRLPVLTRCPPSPHHSPCRSLPYLQQRPVLRLDGKTSTEFRSGGLRQVDGGTAWLDTECGPGKKTVLFEPFIYKNAHLTKTGSGQT
jgi:hypothetical protein